MGSMSNKARLLVAALALGSGMAPAASPEHWQAMARADIDRLHTLVISSHPGWIDERNPGFRSWAEQGYRQALALVPQVRDYNDMSAASRFYLAGFRDGHFGYDSQVRGAEPYVSAGWHSRLDGARVVVVANVAAWPAPLPPVGARLLQCDGREPAAIIREDQAPFADLRDLPYVRTALAQDIALLPFAGRELKRCEFETADGRRLRLDQHYGPLVRAERLRMLAAAQGQARHANRYEVHGDVLWIEAGNFWFEPGGSDAAELDAMIAGLKQLKGIRHIVFDTRGNQGGDSAIGQRIFDAATGGLEYDRAGIEKLPHSYALWRVSETSIAIVGGRRDAAARIYGPGSEQAREQTAWLEQMRQARAAGQPWLRQEGSTVISRAEMRRRHGRLRSFDGDVALLTDADCVSSCLNFADQVRQVPGAVHLGKTTAADAVYIEVGFPALPSGNRVMLPMKVWRDRERGNNEPLVPDLPLEVDMRDDEAVKAATLKALGWRT
jgi:hypothetical protein